MFLAACSGIHPGWIQHKQSTRDLGLIPIGSVIKDARMFETTDCESGFSDCSAMDKDRRRYYFFDGALSRVSVRSGETSGNIKIPGGIRLGENIEEALRKARLAFGIDFYEGKSGKNTILVSTRDVSSSLGVDYSLELVGDENNRLVEIVQRTDF